MRFVLQVENTLIDQDRQRQIHIFLHYDFDETNHLEGRVRPVGKVSVTFDDVSVTNYFCVEAGNNHKRRTQAKRRNA